MHLIATIALLKKTAAFWISKGQSAPPKRLFYAVTDIEKD